ncbi:MAG: hypothetical protein RL485_96, partial [Bacteroidota bacterium]
TSLSGVRRFQNQRNLGLGVLWCAQQHVSQVRSIHYENMVKRLKIRGLKRSRSLARNVNALSANGCLRSWIGSFALVGCDGSGAIYGPTVVRSEMGSEFVFQNALSDRRSANIAKAHHEYPARFH